MLSPNSRTMYTSVLTPPQGMFFDEAIATTFSMDPVLLLEAPVYLALMVEGDQSDIDPLRILNAIRAYSKKITVYVQKGRVQIPQVARPNPLFGLLEDMVTEVMLPNGGVFHPKVWAIRFVNPDNSNIMYRLAVLTRNMTTDQSWDLCLQLEGTMTNIQQAVNEPLSYFVKNIIRITSKNIRKDRKKQAIKFANDLYKIKWEMPRGFHDLKFYLPEIKEFSWDAPQSDRMVVISPFCADKALCDLVEKTKTAEALISRPETLLSLNEGTRDKFLRCSHLDAAAETEDGKEDEVMERLDTSGLHAKVYLLERKYRTDLTHIIMGSANATNAALVTARNCEILVELIGKKNIVGGIDDLLGKDGLGEYLVDLTTTDTADIDCDRAKAEENIEKARMLISKAPLLLECDGKTNDSTWSLVLKGDIPVLNGVVSAFVWPITMPQDVSVNILGLNSSDAISLGAFSVSSITSLIAFELKSQHNAVKARFVLNLPIEGMPNERDAAILQTIINNQDSFMRYLMLLLSSALESGVALDNGSFIERWKSKLLAGENIALLEDLVRMYSRHPERLKEISRLIKDLSQGCSEEIIPYKFKELWSVFEKAMGVNNE